MDSYIYTEKLFNYAGFFLYQFRRTETFMFQDFFLLLYHFTTFVVLVKHTYAYTQSFLNTFIVIMKI